MEDPVPGPVPENELRVSDAERDATLEALREHAAAGRLTMDEFGERARQVLAAKTYGELQLVTRDLPKLASGAAAAQWQAPVPATGALPDGPRRQVRWMVAIMSGSRRQGRLRLTGRINLVSIMGGDELDLREAEIEGGEVTLTAFSIMGGSTIYVPDTINTEVEGFSIMGGNNEFGLPQLPVPGAPTVRIRTYNLMGGCTIWRLPHEARGVSLKEARRLAKRSRRGELGGPPGPGFGS